MKGKARVRRAVKRMQKDDQRMMQGVDALAKMSDAEARHYVEQQRRKEARALERQRIVRTQVQKIHHRSGDL